MKNFLVIVSILLFFTACRKEKDTDAGGTATQALAGE